MVVLVTGAAGFIGFHLCLKLLNDNYTVVGIDSLNDYYDVKLKEERLKLLILMQKINKEFIFLKLI